MHHWSMCLFFWCCQNILKLNLTGSHLNAILADNFHSQISKSRARDVTEKDTHRQQWKGCFLTLWQCSRQQIEGIIHQTVISTLAVTNKAISHIFNNRRLINAHPSPHPILSDSINFLCDWSFSEMRIYTHNRESKNKNGLNWCLKAQRSLYT